MKTYKPIENSDQQLEIQVYYSLGGMNYANYKQEPRGYYLSVAPVKIEKREGYSTISFSAFSGIKTLLLETKRKSDKAYKEACIIAEAKIDQLSAHVLEKLGATTVRKAIQAKIGVSIPPRFDGLTEAQIMSLPVQVVRQDGTKVYENLEEAKANEDLSRLLGAMYGEINGMAALRFETQAVYNILSN